MFSNYMCVFLFFSLIYLTEGGFSKPLKPNIVLIVTDDQDSQLGGIVSIIYCLFEFLALRLYL